MSTPPAQPGDGKPHKAKKPIDKQVDELLAKIEEVEPGTIDPKDLPSWFNEKGPIESTEAGAAEAEIEALLNAPPAESAAPSLEPADAAEPAAAAATETPEQAEMLAALNSALQGLNNDEPAEEPAEPVAAVAAAAAATEPADEALSMEEKLQQEIAALMNAEPQAQASTADDVAEDEDDALQGSFEAPEALAATEAVQASPPSTTSTEDQIAMEIEGLLNTGPADPAAPSADEAAINELDKMLAQEIDTDDELMGEFHSVEDLTAGIQVDTPAQTPDDDEHAATARDVAAELDSQPENAPPPPQPEPAMAAAQPGEDSFAVLSEIADTAEKNEEEHQRRIKMQTPDWERWLNTFKEQSLNICYAINWPARRFLNNEWRATLGLVSLMVAGTSSLFLIGVLIFS